jgi:hypothetical protein
LVPGTANRRSSTIKIINSKAIAQFMEPENNAELVANIPMDIPVFDKQGSA